MDNPDGNCEMVLDVLCTVSLDRSTNSVILAHIQSFP